MSIAAAAIFKVHEIDQEYGAQQNRLLGKIDSGWERDAKIVSIREGFLNQAAPLFGNLAKLLSALFNLECPRTQQRAEKLEYFVAVAIADRVNPAQYGKAAFDITQRCAV